MGTFTTLRVHTSTNSACSGYGTYRCEHELRWCDIRATRSRGTNVGLESTQQRFACMICMCTTTFLLRHRTLPVEAQQEYGRTHGDPLDGVYCCTSCRRVGMNSVKRTYRHHQQRQNQGAQSGNKHEIEGTAFLPTRGVRGGCTHMPCTHAMHGRSLMRGEGGGGNAIIILQHNRSSLRSRV